MKTAFVLVALAGLAAFANAECANACSGHGSCANNDNCVCFPNWMANDCSERVCPYGLAFVDSPAGDLNHNGVRAQGETVVTQRSNVAESEGLPASTSASAHFYAECSNKGLCDRESGSCQCFAGYTGSSCQRTACPNDCSGHGVCRTVQEIAAGGLNYKVENNVAGATTWSGVNPANPVTYRLWDADKSQSCVCDEGYSGPDCTRRECPRGDDPLTHRNRDCGGDADCSDELQTITLTEALASNNWVAWGYFTFQDWTGETWRTDLLELGPNLESGCIVDDGNYGPIPEATFLTLVAAKVKAALEAIPNAALDTVTVTAARPSAAALTLTVEFNKNTGNQNMLGVVFTEATEAAGGPHAACTPNALVSGVSGLYHATPALMGFDAILDAAALSALVLGDVIGVRVDDLTLDHDGISAKPVTVVDVTGGVTVDFPQGVNAATEAVTVSAAPSSLAAGGFTIQHTVAETTKGTAEESTCSNRGLCDYESGLCRCFRGYFEDDCSAQNALAGTFTAAV